MDKKRYFELTTSRKMEPWVELLNREKAVCISSNRGITEEKENVPWRGLKMQNIFYLYALAGSGGKELIGRISVDDADSGPGDVDTRWKRASHLIQEVLCH
ncbi:MAG: hypothetical protein ACLUTA_17630 [Blautia wexlerae]